jgi:hypothetical protein
VKKIRMFKQTPEGKVFDPDPEARKVLDEELDEIEKMHEERRKKSMENGSKR